MRRRLIVCEHKSGNYLTIGQNGSAATAGNNAAAVAGTPGVAGVPFNGAAAAAAGTPSAVPAGDPDCIAEEVSFGSGSRATCNLLLFVAAAKAFQLSQFVHLHKPSLSCLDKLRTLT